MGSSGRMARLQRDLARERKRAGLGEEPDEAPTVTASKKPPSRKTAPTGPLPVMAPADGTPGKRQ
jgi:hypothetical protein